MAFKTRDLLVRQRTQTVNALRGHLTEYGIEGPIGLRNLPPLQAAVLDKGIGPNEVPALSGELLAHLEDLTRRRQRLRSRSASGLDPTKLPHD